MGEFIALLVTSLVGGALGTWWYTKVRLRRAARAFTDGRETMFPGFVLGNQPYCRPAGGLLVLSADALYHVVDRGMPITRRDIPVDRLRVLGTRDATRADNKNMPPGWLALDCLDNAEPVTIACHHAEMRYVQYAFERASTGR